jgi:hypothetical protein
MFTREASPLESSRQQLTEKLLRMADLPNGWSHGEGKPVTVLAIVAAQRYVTMASQLNLRADVFPNPDVDVRSPSRAAKNWWRFRSTLKGNDWDCVPSVEWGTTLKTKLSPLSMRLPPGL